ncbi:hypothetical protein BU15DRAFT_68238 [Melanogaster broomeanus]|nr:hypothetical protein BU15DRAFT_68238 [Melanogaster broomeanus]
MHSSVSVFSLHYFSPPPPSIRQLPLQKTFSPLQLLRKTVHIPVNFVCGDKGPICGANARQVFLEKYLTSTVKVEDHPEVPRDAFSKVATAVDKKQMYDLFVQAIAPWILGLKAINTIAVGDFPLKPDISIFKKEYVPDKNRADFSAVEMFVEFKQSGEDAPSLFIIPSLPPLLIHESPKSSSRTAPSSKFEVRLTSATPGLQDKSRRLERWEKGRSIEELEAPDFRHNASTDLIRQRACEASQHAKPGTIKRMQFTFSLDHLSPVAANVAVSKLDLKPSAAFQEAITRHGRPTTRANVAGDEANGCTSNTHIETETSAGSQKRKNFGSSNEQPFLRFPSLFSSDFGPSALLYAQLSLSNTMNYGEDVTNTSSRGFSIIRPSLDELLSNIDAAEDNHLSLQQCQSNYKVLVDSDVVMQETSQSGTLHTDSQTPRNNYDTVALAKVGPSTSTWGNTPNGRLNLTVKTHNAPTTRSSGPGATATSLNPAVLRGTSNNSAPGGVKAECSNCSATHTPLWRRGLNDELNCNACGLYCKLHKRPRPKSMRANHGETRTQATPRQEMVDGMDRQVGTAQCYNCHTTATPLWRKDDEGKTICNAKYPLFSLRGSWLIPMHW